MVYIDNPELSQQMAQETKDKWEKIANGNEPYPCRICGIAKLPKDFVIQWMDNHWVGKYRYLYECKSCKKQRIYAKRFEERQTVEGAITAIYRQIRQWTKARNLEISITEQDLMDLWTKQGGKCYYTWYDMNYESIVHKQEKQSEKTQMQVSCDRLDPTLWYKQGNVVLCCTIVNKMKNVLTEKEFLNMCKDIVNHRK